MHLNDGFRDPLLLHPGLIIAALAATADGKPCIPNQKQAEAIPPYQVDPNKRCGRNQSCPCGSGKKFKKCCMK